MRRGEVPFAKCGQAGDVFCQIPSRAGFVTRPRMVPFEIWVAGRHEARRGRHHPVRELQLLDREPRGEGDICFPYLSHENRLSDFRSGGDAGRRRSPPVASGRVDHTDKVRRRQMRSLLREIRSYAKSFGHCSEMMPVFDLCCENLRFRWFACPTAADLNATKALIDDLQ